MKYWMMMLWLCISAIQTFGQITWTKTFGGTGDEYVYDAVIKDSFMVICGYTTSYGSGSKDAFINKMDYNGNVIWSRTYGDNYDQVANSIIEANDNGYIFVGYL